VSDGTDEIIFTAAGNEELSVTDAGVQLAGAEARINQFTTAGTTLQDNDTSVPTGAAVKAYGDANWSAGGAGDLKADGSVPLTANWDVGTFTITALTFVSDQATGTAPFTVASTTEVANLKAATATLADAVDITESAGGIVWTDADSLEVLAGTATAAQFLLSGANVTPSWSGATFGEGADDFTITRGTTLLNMDGDLQVTGLGVVLTSEDAAADMVFDNVNFEVENTNASKRSVKITSAKSSRYHPDL